MGSIWKNEENNDVILIVDSTMGIPQGAEIGKKEE